MKKIFLFTILVLIIINTRLSAQCTITIKNPPSTPGDTVQTVCIYTPIKSIHYTTTGGNTVKIEGLPPGISFFWDKDADTIMISGTATQAGTFNYLVTLKCSMGNDTTTTGKIIVNDSPTASAAPAIQTICSGSDITPITFNGSVNGTVYNWTRDNLSVTGNIGASGSGNISGNLTNATSAPAIVVFNITPAYTNAGITCSGDPIEAIVNVNPLPNVSVSVASQTICSGATITPINFTSDVNGTVYNWTRDNTGSLTGIGNSGSGNINGAFINNTASTQTVTFNITAVYGNNCTGQGSFTTATVTINPVPNVSISTASQIICSGATITPINFSSNVTTTTGTVMYNWTRDNTGNVTTSFGNSGSGDITGSMINNTASPQSVTFTITPVYNNCSGMPATATVTVNPVPNVSVSTASQTICSGATITPINFSSDVTGTVYNWTRNTTTVTGIGNSGSGNITGAFINNTASTQTVTFNITAVYGNNCTGSFTTATVIVNPIPSVSASPAIQSICSGSTITQINFNSSLAAGSVVYNWTRDNTGNVTTSFGDSGSGNISGSMINNTSSPQSVTFTVIPTFTSSGGNCTGSPIGATVVVNPTLNVSISIASQTICSGSNITPINFISNVTAGSVMYNWTRDNTGSLTGIGSSGEGNISGSLTNRTNVPITDTFRITPAYTNAGITCTADIIKATVGVNPSPAKPDFKSLSQYFNTDTLTVCKGSNNINFNVITPVSNISYLWSSNSGNVLIRDANDANTVISFKDIPGIYTIQVLATDRNGCKDSAEQIVKVSSISGIDERKIFLKQPGNLLIYPDNTMNAVHGYQWGYDDTLQTIPNKSYSAPIPIAGQVYQSFIPESRFIKNGQLDTVAWTFWVLLEKGGCKSRVYYNGPYAGLRIAVAPPEVNSIKLKVFPNPNNGVFDIALSGNIYGHMHAVIFNTLGQAFFAHDFTKRVPELYERFDTGSLPPGLYFLEIKSSDLKKVQTRFIINR